MTISYLDVDDEITGAVARLRGADDRDVLLVLPPGSHIATSRINFRLLAREARDRHKRLAIASGEAGTRAVAVSAGLPAFSSVDEWRESLRVLRGGDQDEPPRGGVGSDSAPVSPPPAPPAPKADSGSGTRSARSEARASGPDERRRGAGASEETQLHPASVVPSAAALASTAPAAAGRGSSAAAPFVPPARSEPAVTADDAWLRRPMPPAAPEPPDAADVPGRTTGRTRVEGHSPPARRRRVLVAGVLAVLALFVALGGAAAYVLLPSATVRIRPLTERVGPITLSVTADPAVLEPDVEAGVVPAHAVDVPLEATGTYPATGVEVSQTNATGSVVFENLDPSDTNRIAAGAIVATDGDVRFATTTAVTVPASTIQGRTVVPGTAEVGVRAVAPGPAGNVAANAIRNVPPDENPALLEVRNPSATTGGSRTETRFVEEEDYTAAVAELEEQLDAALAQALANPNVAPAGTTLFPGTARRGETTADPAADDVVGQEAEEFELTLTAPATALAVDESVLEPLAAERLTSSIPEGWQMFPDSVETSHDSGQVGEDGTITFAVRAAAEQWRPLDPEALRAEIRGLPLADARERLTEHGEVEIETWPSFATTIPTIDSRLQIEVLPPARGSA